MKDYQVSLLIGHAWLIAQFFLLPGWSRSVVVIVGLTYVVSSAWERFRA